LSFQDSNHDQRKEDAQRENALDVNEAPPERERFLRASARKSEQKYRFGFSLLFFGQYESAGLQNPST
jgi:hypothetical protein